uniref:Uncharacterized protein n=1 Tax=Candidatus Kentrum eta TaxID=2126337 RepID=A0A450UZX3_9GAMM|nr:MAG: hypothetical protein BECKH772A_GA0070896_1001923 [Candidatus Kentron sp. H]VFJ91411.1 MAG: hypothetical protein BECKH772B_GA0070898_1001723 [Candidatus Kentron sp. H]VFJ98110.1 MAG: hypothetical protein BECKH772C_GA0070978_1001823 [Candidatus Kentron sp. H]
MWMIIEDKAGDKALLFHVRGDRAAGVAGWLESRVSHPGIAAFLSFAPPDGGSITPSRKFAGLKPATIH